ncbi:MAG: TPM domain-containing protein [Balneolaceae bacterium]|nr:TPM domain-containing protein [Balneolaceae bacterium]
MTRSSSLFNSYRTYVLLLCVFIAAPALLSAQQYRSEPVGMVNDFANILSSSEVQSLENKLRNYRDTTTTAIVIASISDLEGVSIEEAATTIFNDWKIWHEDQYNGVLILIAPNERKMRIEVGYGLEGAIPDVMAGRIIRDVLTPQFKRGNFYAGLDRATDILIDLAEGEFEGNISSTTSANEDDVASVIVFILFIIFVIYSILRKGGRKGRQRTLGSGGFIWLGGGGFGSGGGGGSSFGGFSGGGGFGSGGGGASGGW